MHTFYAFAAQNKSGFNDFRDSISTEMWSHNNQKNEHAHSRVCVMSDSLCMMCHQSNSQISLQCVYFMCDEFWVISPTAPLYN